MNNGIVIYTAGYLAISVILMGFGYALYYVTRRVRVAARIVVNDRPHGKRGLNSAYDDRS